MFQFDELAHAGSITQVEMQVVKLIANPTGRRVCTILAWKCILDNPKRLSITQNAQHNVYSTPTE